MHILHNFAAISRAKLPQFFHFLPRFSARTKYGKQGCHFGYLYGQMC